MKAGAGIFKKQDSGSCPGAGKKESLQQSPDCIVTRREKFRIAAAICSNGKWPELTSPTAAQK